MAAGSSVRRAVYGEENNGEALVDSLQGLEQAYISGHLRNIRVSVWGEPIVELHTPLSSLRPSSDLAKNSAGKLFW